MERTRLRASRSGACDCAESSLPPVRGRSRVARSGPVFELCGSVYVPRSTDEPHDRWSHRTVVV
ncbi:hypothetical protein D8S78_01990 [Natrialba swarupiae]|nr:hypothetical protein [Natrialba swarupiae]